MNFARYNKLFNSRYIRGNYYSASSKSLKSTSLTKNESIPDDFVGSNPLTDSFGRFHSYLRISLIEKCNLRCKFISIFNDLIN